MVSQFLHSTSGQGGHVQKGKCRLCWHKQAVAKQAVLVVIQHRLWKIGIMQL